ncbi:MAG: hypothetical protein VX672_01400 [Planctomycetota bacterium]|nr:hypothetical protein [Planctomycetota bacterium]
MRRLAKILVIPMLATLVAGSPLNAEDDHSVARRWNELLLESIRNDRARPVVHARNLFHLHAAMWDAWRAFEDLETQPWLVDEVGGTVEDVRSAREEAISHAAYTILRYRFLASPGFPAVSPEYDALMIELGFDPTDSTSTGDSPVAIGNRIAIQYILFGLSDNANEAADYANQWYYPINEPLLPPESGTQDVDVPDRWQPLALDYFVDQSGNVEIDGYPEFLGAEWGNVVPFSLRADQRTDNEREGFPYPVYLDPGVPPMLGSSQEQAFLEGFEQVLRWSEHLDPTDGVMLDASPNTIGNAVLPTDPADFAAFYDADQGGDVGSGYTSNPVTGAAYATQMVPRADYARVLAEFWADGPDSETPPGHWFTILNDVMDHPLFERRLGGAGPELDPLEYDVKAYFALGGCMHDAAIAAWGCKGWYDYVRPISAIRWMAENGQRSDPLEPGYDPHGLELIPGLVEIVTPESTAPGERHEGLEGEKGENLGKIAVRCWRGPDYIADPAVDLAGCGWILAVDWWPYQRPTFVTPNFAGYVSGHSTFSRAAAELLTLLTGSPWFPGGLAEYVAPANEFLVFEEGPSVDVRLPWVSYRDASDQCSLSRIWGGIHPPADDLPGRLMGLVIGPQAWNHAVAYFGEPVTCPEDFNGDGTVNGQDLGFLLVQWSCTGSCEADLNGDLVVDGADIGIFIAAFGGDC